MFKHRTGWLRQIAGRADTARRDGADASAALEALEALLDCVHRFVGHGRCVRTARSADLVRLREAVGALTERCTALLADPERARALHTGQQLWTVVDPGMLDAVLHAGDRALRAGLTDLSLRACDTVLTAKPASRAAWRLRARTLEARGNVAEAIEAHQEYLALVPGDDLGVGARVAELRDRGPALRRIAELLREQAGDAAAPAADTPAEEAWTTGLALRDQGNWEEARPLLAHALARFVEQDRSDVRTRAALTDYLGILAAADPELLAESTALVEAVTGHLRAGRTRPMADPELGGTRVIGVSDFRNLVQGRSVCLVADSELLRRSPTGAEIDSYDLVVRFDSYTIDAPFTGVRTDIHVSDHGHTRNWGEPVTIRIVLGRLQHAWQRSIRALVPGAQRYVNDRSLRRPVADRALVGDDAAPAAPTSGFAMLRLLDFLDVNPVIDLVGFDVDGTDAHRYEKEWVRAHATKTTDTRISLR